MEVLPEEGEVPPRRNGFSRKSLLDWRAFKASHPPGTTVTGEVLSTAPYGCYVDLGVPYRAVLLVPYLDPARGVPRVGQEISALIRHYGDDVGAEAGEIALRQV